MPDAPAEHTPPSAEAAGPQRAAPSGCWRVGGITCGVLFCLFGVLFFALFIAVRPQLGPVVTQWRNVILECPEKLAGDAGLQGALQRYRARTGDYPAALLDLYPTYVTRRETFHCPADPSAPVAVSYIYRRPPPNAPSNTVVLICDHHNLPGAHVRILVPIEGALRRETKPLPRRSEP